MLQTKIESSSSSTPANTVLFGKIQICRTTFKFSHGISQGRLTGFFKWYKWQKAWHQNKKEVVDVRITATAFSLLKLNTSSASWQIMPASMQWFFPDKFRDSKGMTSSCCLQTTRRQRCTTCTNCAWSNMEIESLDFPASSSTGYSWFLLSWQASQWLICVGLAKTTTHCSVIRLKHINIYY